MYRSCENLDVLQATLPGARFARLSEFASFQPVGTPKGRGPHFPEFTQLPAGTRVLVGKEFGPSGYVTYAVKDGIAMFSVLMSGSISEFEDRHAP